MIRGPPGKPQRAVVGEGCAASGLRPYALSATELGGAARGKRPSASSRARTARIHGGRTSSSSPVPSAAMCEPHSCTRRPAMRCHIASGDALSCALVGMNADLMSQYIEYVADRLMVQLGVPKVWNTPNPFDWMESISLQGKANFFEHRVDQYQKANVMTSTDKGVREGYENYVFRTDVDF